MERISGRNQVRSPGGLAPALLVALSLASALQAQPPVLSKEYIRLGGRILATEVQAPTGNSTFEGWACPSCGISTSGWQVVGAADFDGNGVPDLVYQNTSTYQINVDYYGGPGGATFIGWACLSCSVPGGTAGWQVVAVADFNRDGVPDLVYQNQQTNQVNVNYFGGGGGSVVPGWAMLNSGAGMSGWRVAGAADFDGNGTPDLIWQNNSTNQVNVNYYTGTTLTGYAVLNSGSGMSGWRVAAAADFDGNGVPDLVWQNSSINQVNVNYYGGSGGATMIGSECLSCSVPGGVAGWQVRAAADFDGNGTPDPVYQNTQSPYAVHVNYYYRP